LVGFGHGAEPVFAEQYTFERKNPIGYVPFSIDASLFGSKPSILPSLLPSPPAGMFVVCWPMEK
jgi:hypothetical protein